jgi:hypothetical protein
VPNTKDDDGEPSRPMLTRQSEEGPVFSIGDDEFGNWADDDDDDENTYFPAFQIIVDFD